MWVHNLFFLAIFFMILFFWFNLAVLDHVHIKAALSFLAGGDILGNLYFLSQTWGNIHVTNLPARSLVMFWLGYPEYSLVIETGLLALVYLLVPYRSFKFRLMVAVNTVFVITLAFQLRILKEGFSLIASTAFIDVCYQALNVAFVGSCFIFVFMLVYAAGKIVLNGRIPNPKDSHVYS